MSAYYTYLIASLPMLHFAGKPPFSFTHFLGLCRGLIPGEEIGLLSQVEKIEGLVYKGKGAPTLKRRQEFEVALRNELVRIRATRRHQDMNKYLRVDGFTEPYISRLAMGAYRNTSILESERMLDQGRWNMLEEFSCGHYFDFDYLIIYALKLLILERWEKINMADKARLLSETLGKGQNKQDGAS
ncbi:MAG: DUF2764 family protein [Candidatus Omnitrophica bacterium]|nr:DUF2764 family protein [Candidatus Omnitrophota bacterium]